MLLIAGQLSTNQRPPWPGFPANGRAGRMQGPGCGAGGSLLSKQGAGHLAGGPRGRSAEDKRPGAAQLWPGVQGVQTQSRASCSVLFSAFFRVFEGTSPPQCCAMEVFSGEALSYLHHHQARASEGHLPPHQLGRDTLDCVVLTTLYSSLTLSPHCRGCVARRPRLQPWLLRGRSRAALAAVEWPSHPGQ